MPAQGDIVLVAATDPDDNSGTKVVPAIVVRVWPALDATDEAPAQPEHITTRVFADNADWLERRAELTVVADLAAVTDPEERIKSYQLLPQNVPAAAPADTQVSDTTAGQ